MTSFNQNRLFDCNSNLTIEEQFEFNKKAFNYAEENKYNTREDLVLILGTSNNDIRFKDQVGFAINIRSDGGGFNENKSIQPETNKECKLLQLIYNLDYYLMLTKKMSNFKFSKIYFDYNVLDLLHNADKFFFKTFFSFLLENGNFYIPLTSSMSKIYNENNNKYQIPSYLKDNYILNKNNNTYQLKLNEINLSKFNFGQRINLFLNNTLYLNEMNIKELSTLILYSYFKDIDYCKIDLIDTNNIKYPLEPRLPEEKDNFNKYFLLTKY